jgi:Ca2+-binding RTX toxin-like protein
MGSRRRWIGSYDDSTSAKPTYTYDSAGSYAVDLRVSDGGASDTLDQPLTISAGNTPPQATIESPLSSTTWKVGDRISFSGSATDQEDGTLGSSRMSWSLILHHCYSADNCHEHPLQDFSGVAQGTFVAPDHEYPAYLELRLSATDSGGLSDAESVRLDPQTVQLDFRTSPSGLRLVLGSDPATTPFSRTAIVGSKNTISAPSPQTLGGTSYQFSTWSDGGAQTHDVTAGATASTYTAVFESGTCTVTGTSAGEIINGTPTDDVICAGAGPDMIKGLGGNDILKGEKGADKLFGGAGDDALDGGAGTDTANFSESPSAVSASLTDNIATGEGSDALAAMENLNGSKYAGTLTGSIANNVLNGSSGNDTLEGLDGADKLTGGGSNDSERGGPGNDTVTGSGGADELFGEEGDDAVNSKDGVSGNDALDGGSGADTKMTDATEKSIVGFP